MQETAENMSRVEILEQCVGMDAVRAGRMLTLLPELGKVSTSYALRLAGLSAAHEAKEIDLTRKKALQIHRLLAECMKDVLQDQESGLYDFLRHLIEKDPAGAARKCLAAVLRFYSDTLRHPYAINAGTETPVDAVYPEDGDSDLIAAEKEPDVK